MTSQTTTIKADPITAAIFKALADGEKCICDLKEAIGIPRTWVSYDLMMLEDLKAIKSRTVNGHKYYSLGESRALWHLRRWVERQEPATEGTVRPVEYDSAVEWVRRSMPRISEAEAMFRRGC